MIVQGKWVLPALKQLLQIAKVIAKNSCHKAEKVYEHFCSPFLCSTFQCAVLCRILS